MTISFDKVADRVFKILKSRDYSLKMYQENGDVALDPSLEARKFWVEDEGIMVAINKNAEDSEIKVYISQDTKLDEIEPLSNALRQTANFYGLLYNIRKYGKNLTPKQFAFLAYKSKREEEEEMTESVRVPKEIIRAIDALLLRELTPHQIHEELIKFEFAGVRGPLKFVIDEYIQEGYRNLAEAKDTSSLWGSSHSSYQRIGSKQARLVVRHSQPVDEDKFAARSRHINKIFIENADGERIKFPTNYLQGARAMTRHVSMGGNFNDAIGEHIQHISEEFAVLRKFKSNAGRKLGEQATGIVGLVRNRGKEITAEVKGMQGPSSYKKYVENFEPKEQTLEEDIVILEAQRIAKIFDSVKTYDGIDEAYIAVARLSRMNEDFESIAEMLESGNIGFTPKRDVRSGTQNNGGSVMLNKLYDLAERATDQKVSGFISRVAEKITNDIPMERAELNLVKGIVGIAEGTSTPVVAALDEFVDWADTITQEDNSPYLDKEKRSEKDARKDMAKSKQEWEDAEARQPGLPKRKKAKEAGSPKLDRAPHSNRRSEEEARADIEANKKKEQHFWPKEDEMEEGGDHWKKGHSRHNKRTKKIKYRTEDGGSSSMFDFGGEKHPNITRGGKKCDTCGGSGQEGYKTKCPACKGKGHHSKSNLPGVKTQDKITQEDDMDTSGWSTKEKANYARAKRSDSDKAKGRNDKRKERLAKKRGKLSGKLSPSSLDTRSTESIQSEFTDLSIKDSHYRILEKELYDRSITETTDNIIRFQELAGIQKKS